MSSPCGSRCRVRSSTAGFATRSSASARSCPIPVAPTQAPATKRTEGTGIGLAVSARIAREHDGWIDVVTQMGRGSTFTVYLPPIVRAVA
ncbi:MAG: hypothetical protein E6J90_17060 [Deltaproteobacteria bacterium]|nr:MAG: hypothetical protein E6J91_41955 [Deltaproteobacteria bacterium]TMQ20040.1 MAG: hypothetical protein E6J90_17060 [Deltaproteobacteria bacterium]